MATRLVIGAALLVLGLTACDLKGLDLYKPVDARDYVNSCARSATDVYCEALQPTLSTVGGPVSVIMPNEGDADREAALARLLTAKGMTVEAFLKDEAAKAAFARANVFPVAQLTTGTHTTLDGTPHQVVCTMTQTSGGRAEQECQIDGLNGVNELAHLQPPTGTVYRVTRAAPDAPAFFPF